MSRRGDGRRNLVPGGLRANLRALTAKDAPYPAELTGPWHNYTGKPPIFVTLIFAGALALTAEVVYAVIRAAADGWHPIQIAGDVIALLFVGVCVVTAFPLRRIWRYYLRSRRSH